MFWALSKVEAPKYLMRPSDQHLTIVFWETVIWEIKVSVSLNRIIYIKNWKVLEDVNVCYVLFTGD